MEKIDVPKWRKRTNRLLKRMTAARSLILMYHRIAEPGGGPWGLSVTPEHFAEHLAVLKAHSQLISLRELAAALRAGKCPDGAVALTFDDGYADNLYQAKPILEENKVPATVFIATGFIEEQRAFWWDRLEQICFQPAELPDVLELKIKGRYKQWQLAGLDSQSRQEKYDGQGRARMLLYHAVWKQLLRVTHAERDRILDDMAAGFHYQPAGQEKHRPLAPAEVTVLASGNWVDIGAHTVNHLALATHSKRVQEAEIARSKMYLEQLLKRPVHSFSYPFGSCGWRTAALARKLGLECACSTAEESVWPGSGLYRLPRIGVQDWDGRTFKEKLFYYLQNT